ncbi:hypothetical protein DYB32_007880 [Aphanomyces invadans]|uniref:Cupin-like domain-containing protein n=1 Tax=Aphanomyces invadans TaxID=157072 RepID=A0A3R6Y423_9STRA|nr:hypothetical protein DYB32_007880 [Aphanomyces invadans]
MLYYPRHDVHAAKSCLLPGLPSAETYTGPVSAPNVVAFVNARAHTHRLPTGEINPLASIARNLETQLYTVPTTTTTSACKTIDAADLTPALFEQYILRNEPVIITRAAPNLNFHRILRRGASIPDFVLNHLESPDKVLVRPAATNMPFASFIDRLTSALPSKTSYYLEYLSMATYVPELMANAPQYPWATSSFLELDVANLWFGDGKSVGKLYFDAYENLMTMVAGEKEFVLFDPSDNRRLYEGHMREAQFERDDYDSTVIHRRKLMESTSMVNSPINIDDPLDIDRYPLFASATALRCKVRSTPAVHEPRNVAVNYWYKPLYTKEFPCKTCPLRFNLAYEHVLQTLAHAANTYRPSDEL